jgi:hypothetical protein
MNTRFSRKMDKINDLLVLADTGRPRPPHTTVLGKALSNYTCPATDSFDAVFAEIVRERRPDWFGQGSRPRGNDNTPPEQVKTLMIDMALGHYAVEPSHPWHPLLVSYTDPRSAAFDAGFTKLVTLLAPDWIEPTGKRLSDAATSKQAILLAAQAGWERPSRKTRMGQLLSTYVSRNHVSFDADFVTRLRVVRPEWLGPRVDVTEVSLAA